MSCAAGGGIDCVVLRWPMEHVILGGVLRHTNSHSSPSGNPAYCDAILPKILLLLIPTVWLSDFMLCMTSVMSALSLQEFEINTDVANESAQAVNAGKWEDVQNDTQVEYCVKPSEQACAPLWTAACNAARVGFDRH